MMRFALTFLMLLQGTMCSVAAQAAFDHSGWNTLLTTHVVTLLDGQATQVDYVGFADDRPQLKQYLNNLSGVPRTESDHFGKPDQLTFLINAYNAWTVELVLTAYPNVTSITDLGSLFQSPWKKRFIPLLGDTRSLDDIEQDLIRGSGRYNDLRIHFAVNCASIGCPALRAEAYAADRLDAQLEESVTEFLSDRTRNRFEDGVLRISSIFKWYRNDFEKGWRSANNLGQFLALYRQSLGLDVDTANRLVTGDIAIVFLDYDWRLNATTRGKP